MAKNIIFIILFIVLYGGLFLFVTNKNDSALVDRNGYGTLTDEYYDCERFSVKMEFEPEWLVFDGITIDGMPEFENFISEAERYLAGSTDNVDFLCGFATPDSNMVCLAIKGSIFSKSVLNETTLRSAVDNMRKTMDGYGGFVGSASCRTIKAKGNGNNILIYYYDYEINGERVSIFSSFTNSGGDAIMIAGSYNNIDGLNTLTDFVENKFTIYSDFNGML